MTAKEIRSSFLEFFREKEHTVVPSSSLMPDAPNLLFTNAGMNQFVPIFLEETPCAYKPPRAADTQKCIRAGGKHNDLEDVGFDTYHHTFFEMLGNWSFGDYFKKEAIEWAWELVTGRWHFPPQRLYATVYKPGEGDPSELDQDAYEVWERIFRAAGLDPAKHIVYGGKKDNFWMMGDTGPCGPCSELHIDLTPDGDSEGKLVNRDDPRCIEIWNLVFIQFNATPDGKFLPLPARHVDTGMGYERVCSIIQGTKNLTDFKNAKISNYDTDVFAPIFHELEALSGKKYASTLPERGAASLTEQEKVDVAFRVIGDHIRTLSFSIADGILPSNEGRGYVLRRILRRAVRYGRELGLTDLFFYKLVDVVARTMGEVFPELQERQSDIEKVIRAEEESFSRTLSRGIELFNKVLDGLGEEKIFPGEDAFKLYDTYGFPLDLTQLMARERGLTVDEAVFEKHMEEQKKRSGEARKNEVIEVAESVECGFDAEFVGYEQTSGVEVKVCTHQVDFGKNEEEFVRARLYFSPTPFYAEMGGQVGDTGVLEFDGQQIEIIDTKRGAGGAIVHLTEDVPLLEGLSFPLIAKVDPVRRALIEAHHSATHIMHWALREVLGDMVAQKGSYVGPDRLRFDFSHLEAMKPEQIEKVEALVNERIEEKTRVDWQERPYAEVRQDKTVMQLFGEKYGETVRVVDIGGFSKELCGGTHVRNTGNIGSFRIISEGAIAAGIRRIEAIAGEALRPHLKEVLEKQEEEYRRLTEKKESARSWPGISLGKPVDALWEDFVTRRQALKHVEKDLKEWEKQRAKAEEAGLREKAAQMISNLIDDAEDIGSVPFIGKDLGLVMGGQIPQVINELKRKWKGIALLAGTTEDGKVVLAALVDPAFSKKIPAGEIIKTTAPLVGGRGGGRPEMAQGGGTEPGNITKALEAGKQMVESRAADI